MVTVILEGGIVIITIEGIMIIIIITMGGIMIWIVITIRIVRWIRRSTIM